MWGHSNSMTRQWIECGSSCLVLRTSCSRTSSATHIASGTSETSSSGKRNGDSGMAARTYSINSAVPSPVLAETGKYSTRSATSPRFSSSAISSTASVAATSCATTASRPDLSILLTTTHGSGRVARRARCAASSR